MIDSLNKQSLNNQVEEYLDQVQSFLVADDKIQTVYIDHLRAEIKDYIERNHVSNIKEVCLYFGEPEECAQKTLKCDELKTINKRISVRNVICIASAIIIALTIVFCVITPLATDYDTPVYTYTWEEYKKLFPERVAEDETREYQWMS